MWGPSLAFGPPQGLGRHGAVVCLGSCRLSVHHLNTLKQKNTFKGLNKKNKMIQNQKKPNVMIFNFTDKYKFTTNLNLSDENIVIVKQVKFLGCNYKWWPQVGKNIEYSVKKSYWRMELPRKIAEFTKLIEDKREIYMLYIRSILEQSCVVWNMA